MTTADIYQRPIELLQQLIRFDTTNPPGNETECIHYIRDLLAIVGIESQIIAKAPDRPNLLARLPGAGHAPTLMLYGHVDVVTTANQDWTHPPFAAEIADGYIWGRGTLDMKGGVAMMLAAFMRAHVEQLSLPGDVLFLALADEENRGIYGAEFLAGQHADLFQGVRYAIGELGGYTTTIGGGKFYPIQVAEKLGCATRLTIKGPGGHGSMPMRGGAMARLGRVLQTLDENRLPLHIIPAVRTMIDTIADSLPEPTSTLVRQLLDPAQTDAAMTALGSDGLFFEPLLHNTANATMVEAGHKRNVIPTQVTLDLDCRMVPGQTPDDLLGELRALLGDDLEFEVVYHYTNAAEVDMGLYDTLAGILHEADPTGIPIPFVMPAGTDGRFFSRIGIQTYGFIPMQLPAWLDFIPALHAADERIPVEAMAFGTNAIYQLLQRFGD
jgi:acetylornithine deacetylase/succinyl-diaminopimelate desuccinylase-like protein